ncbi:hypothetical protein M0812_14197 [Anaeramoeba flamelloides]|uniref:Uncharacterized protein n=1 Tax=Anaeramoeba flamelloides TaxID=1746091 RepID=A0AAV7ZL04_9EUKA|nr:hypothetical protein M0812_14197 [Anaeramoeba flamelloides]
MKKFALLLLLTFVISYVSAECGDFDEMCCVYKPVKGYTSTMDLYHTTIDHDKTCPSTYKDQFGALYNLCVSKCVFSAADCGFTNC